MTTVINSTQVLVHTPLQKAFEYVSDLTKHPEWSGGELKIEALTPGPIAIGKEYLSKGQVATQKDRPNTVKSSQYESPRTFGFVANDSDFGNVHHVFTFTEQNGGVMITRTVTTNLKPMVALAFRLLIYPLIGKPAMNKAMARLKTKLE